MSTVVGCYNLLLPLERCEWGTGNFGTFRSLQSRDVVLRTKRDVFLIYRTALNIEEHRDAADVEVRLYLILASKIGAATFAGCAVIKFFFFAFTIVVVFIHRQWTLQKTCFCLTKCYSSTFFTAMVRPLTWNGHYGFFYSCESETVMNKDMEHINASK